jgi:16S rRNA processing protein RimM
LIRIARITKAQGLHGAMRVETILDDDRVFEAGRPVTLIDGVTREDLKIESSRVQNGRRILKLSGIDSIDDVERRIGAELNVREDELPQEREGTFYTFHLKGSTVTTVRGDTLGIVTDFLDSGGTPLLKVDGKGGEVLIPFAWSYLRKIDRAQRSIEVDLPEGLLDLNT